MVPAVLIAHPRLGLGGSEARALWAVAALQGWVKPTLASSGAPSLDTLNRHCGTGLHPDDFDLRLLDGLPQRLLGQTDALRGALFRRSVAGMARRFDVCVSAYNPTDFGKPGLHFVADLAFCDALRAEFHQHAGDPRRWLHRPGPVRSGYLAVVQGFAGRGRYDRSRDWLIANSQWSARVLRERLGLRCRAVVYPPVADVVPAVAWPARQHAFVCLGRVSPEKRIERVIDILGRVRALGHDVRLRIIGAIGDDAYGRMIAGRIAANAGWCEAAGGVYGPDKLRLLARHRWAIHGCTAEAFGIAVAEQVKCGCVPFVPAGSGAAEIVAEPALCFGDVDEAVARIDALLRAPAYLGQVRGHLARRARAFSANRFMSEFRSLVEAFVAEQGSAAGGRGPAGTGPRQAVA